VSNLIPKRCPNCGWYFRLINEELGLFECSKKECNTLLQHYIAPIPLKQGPKDASLDLFKPMEEKIE